MQKLSEKKNLLSLKCIILSDIYEHVLYLDSSSVWDLSAVILRVQVKFIMLIQHAEKKGNRSFKIYEMSKWSFGNDTVTVCLLLPYELVLKFLMAHK